MTGPKSNGVVPKKKGCAAETRTHDAAQKKPERATNPKQIIENIKNGKNENHQKHVILEGFSQNGLQIRIQRNFLRISTPVKIDFRHFFKFYIFRH